MEYDDTETISPARAPMTFPELATDASHRIESAMRRCALSGTRLHVWAWPSFKTDGETLPGEIYTSQSGEDRPADPYAAHRQALPIYVRPKNAPGGWMEVPYSHVRTRLHDALSKCPIMGSRDSY